MSSYVVCQECGLIEEKDLVSITCPQCNDVAWKALTIEDAVHIIKEIREVVMGRVQP